MEQGFYTPGMFAGKKITVMGLGLLGRGIGDVKFLAEEGAELIVTDLKTETELAESLQVLSGFSNISYVLGEHRLEDFRNRDFILKAAGVPLDSPYIAEAHKNGVPVKMSTSLFAKHTPAMIVGITGTRGKSTVTHMLYEVLKNAIGEESPWVPALKTTRGRKVFLGGNVRGVSTLPFLREAKAGDIAVLELDSWQLQGFGDERISPHIAIFTTFMVDHLNYYKGDLEAYFEDKAKIFKYQKKGDCLILGPQVADQVFARYKLEGGYTIADPKKIPADWKLPLPGEHNRDNIAITIEAARQLGVPAPVLQKSIETFKGVPGRLELLRTWNGVKIYNDTNATTPDATLAALKAVAIKKNVLLIMGGADKGIDMTNLLEEIPKACKAVLFLPGTGSTRIEADLKKVNTDIIPAASLEQALHEAVARAEKGDVIILSPAFASFGLFKNEYDRGDQFNALVARL